MEGNAPDADAEPRRTLSHRNRLVILGAVLLLALLGVGAGLLIANGGGSSSATTTTSTTAASRPVTPLGPLAASPGVLATIAKAAGTPIYWLGEQQGYRYELTRTSAGDVYIRYLPPGAQVGNRQATYRVVATYPYANALAALKAVPGGKVTSLPHGGLVVATNADRKSVHLAFPGQNYEIEVYDPAPGRALALVLAGRVVPVG